MATHFTPESFKFLNQLKRNNSSDWFHANKTRYEEHVKGPMLAFVAELAPRMAKLSKHIRVDPKPVGGSMLRVNRDTRFSKDKSPYKTSIGARFMLQGAGEAMLGYYLSIEPGNNRGYAGIWEPEGPALTAIRKRIMDRSKEWDAAAGAAFRKRFEFDGESLKKPPKGVAEDHPHAEDLRRKSFAAFTRFDDRDVCDAKFMDRYVRACEEGAGLMRFVCAAIDVKY